MPLYDFKCSEGHIFERFVKLEDFDLLQHCSCHAPSVRVISTPMFTVDHTGYSCPVTDRWIGSKHEHRENLKLTGCRVLEAGETEASQRARAKAEAELDSRVDQTVEREWDSMPSAKREKIANELTSGVDLAVVRQTA